jgi:heme O synthase-like polyprenyltransferase
MLPVKVKPRTAAGWVLFHTVGAALAAMALAADPALGWIYLVPTAVAMGGLLLLNVRLLAAPNRRRALTAFHASNVCLGVVLLSICVSTLVA